MPPKIEIKLKRKVFRNAPNNTREISIPKIFCDAFDIQQGDPIIVSAIDGHLDIEFVKLTEKVNETINKP